MPKKKVHRHHPRLRKYNNIILLIVSIYIALFLSQQPWFKEFLFRLGDFGYIGAFFAGALFSSTFTVTIGVVMLSYLADFLHPLEIGIIAGAGAVLCDFLIFKFVKGGIVEEVTPIYNDLGGKHLSHLLHTKFFSWTLPVIGALIIISPVPDELGVSLLGLSKMTTIRFLMLSFLLNVVGISLVVTASRLI